jgi:hypothetical protein
MTKGVQGNKKIYPGVEFFSRASLAGLLIYIIRNTSIYGNMTSVMQALASLSVE